MKRCGLRIHCCGVFGEGAAFEAGLEGGASSAEAGGIPFSAREPTSPAASLDGGIGVFFLRATVLARGF
jgi:hypothetical protein